MNNKHHKSDAFQVSIQLIVVTTKGNIYMKTQAVCAKRLNVEKLHIKYLLTFNSAVAST